MVRRFYAETLELKPSRASSRTQVRRQRIFISYRRSDSAGHAGRLNADLTRLLGRRVFMDVSNIAPGAEFRGVLDGELRSCGAVLAVIGPQWKAAFDLPRDGEDFVRVELGQALGCEGMTVIPVLVQGASLPAPASLPAELKPLADLQAVSLRDDRWKDDVEHLADQLRRSLTLRRFPLWATALGCALIAAIAYGVMNIAPEPAPYDRDRAHEATIAATQSAAQGCEHPQGAEGECPIVFRFKPNGTVEDVHYDTGSCAFKGVDFGDCVLRKLERTRIHPFNDHSFVEIGLDLRIEPDGGVKITP